MPADEVRLYLALREAAHQRLFAHVPWLRAHLVDAVERLRAGHHASTPRGSRRRSASIDPTNPEALQEALTGGLFEPEDTPEQKAALARLETALALVEGWVDEVVDAAADRAPARRRRAARDGAPPPGQRRAGRADLRHAGRAGAAAAPAARGRRAVAAVAADARGIDGRDAVWAHPDLLPTADDLDDPAGFAAGGSAPLDLSGLDDTEAPPEPARARCTPSDLHADARPRR